MKRKKYASRVVYINKRFTNVLMAREILGLPVGAGHRSDQADHRNQDTLDNREENLRVATPGQNVKNRGRQANASCRFKGIRKHRNKFQAVTQCNRKQLSLGSFKEDVEAALVYFYAGTVLYDEFFYGSVIPVAEMPSEERQEELWQLVLSKLRKVGLLAEV